MTRPAELYRFVQDATVWTWTSADEAEDYNSETYTPIPIGRSDIEQGSDINRVNLSVTVPRDNPLGAAYIANMQDSAVSLTVFRKTDGGTAVIWKGRVVMPKARGSEITLECESVFTSLRLMGLQARYQKPCRHAHYGRGCYLDPEAFAVPGLCAATADAVITVPEAAGYPDGEFLAGMLRSPDGVLRYVVGHVGDQITLSRPNDALNELVAGTGYGMAYGESYGGIAITLYPGCNRSMTRCEEFDNLDAYGGFPWIPSKNPMGGSSIV